MLNTNRNFPYSKLGDGYFFAIISKFSEQLSLKHLPEHIYQSEHMSGCATFSFENCMLKINIIFLK